MHGSYGTCLWTGFQRITGSASATNVHNSHSCRFHALTEYERLYGAAPAHGTIRIGPYALSLT